MYDFSIFSTILKCSALFVYVKTLKTDVLDITITKFLPSEMDQYALREEVKSLVWYLVGANPEILMTYAFNYFSMETMIWGNPTFRSRLF